jgi:hypothetical protein
MELKPIRVMGLERFMEAAIKKIVADFGDGRDIYIHSYENRARFVAIGLYRRLGRHTYDYIADKFGFKGATHLPEPNEDDAMYIDEICDIANGYQP